MNGVVEAANNNIKNIMQKMIVTYKDWYEMLSFALHAYHIIIRTSTRATPYSLVYRIKAVMSLKTEILFIRVLMELVFVEID